MSSRDVDVVARLRLNADQFSSETGKRFAEMSQRAAKAADVIRADFVGSFAEVQKIAAQSLKLPRTSGGSLDLSGEIAELNRVAAAAEQQSLALKELKKAKLDAAFAGTASGQAMRIEADAAMVAAAQQDDLSVATRRRIADLEAVQAELNRTASATQALMVVDEAAARQATEWRSQAAAARIDVAGRIADAFLTPVGSGKSARESASVFEEVAREQAAAEARMVQAAGAATQQFELYARRKMQLYREEQTAAQQAADADAALTGRIVALRSAIDPAYAAQHRFNAELANARDLTSRGAITLDEYCAVLRREEAALEQARLAGGRHAGGMGQQRAAVQQLGFQLNDVATQYAAGTSASIIFAQQSGQVIQALQLMGVEGGGVLKFLGSWQGAVLSAIAIAAIPFIAKLVEGNNELDKAAEKLRKDERETIAAGQAKTIFANTIDGLTQAVRTNREALDQLDHADETAARHGLVDAIKTIERTKAYRAQTEETLRLAEATVTLNNARAAVAGQDARVAGPLQDENRGLQDRIAQMKKDLAKSDGNLVANQANLENWLSRRVVERAATLSDPLARIKERYEGRRGLIEAARQEATAEEVRNGTLTRQIKLLKEREAVETAAEQRRQSAGNRAPPTLGAQINADRGAALLSSAQGFNGLSERSGPGRSQLTALFAEAGKDVDPKMTAWCAAFVNAVLATNGLPGTGSLAANSFLNYGTKTNKPQAGDIVVLRTGRSQEHVGFYAGERNGRVLVTGGNQSGGQVSITSFARSAVEAFRRAPDAASSARDAAHDASVELRQLKQDLDAVTGAFDPARAAAVDYAETMERLARLNDSGDLPLQQQIDYAIAARRKLAAASSTPLPEHPFGEDLLPGLRGLEVQHGSRAANDNRDRDIADAQREMREQGAETIRYLSGLYGDLFNGQTHNIFDNLKRLGSDAAADYLAQQSKRILDGLEAKHSALAKDIKGSLGEGSAYGGIGGSVFATITGGKNNALTSQIGGVLGDVAGKAVGKEIARGATGLLKSLGGAAGPIGSIVGGVLGSALGGLLSKRQNSGAGISTAGGNFSAGTAVGTSAALKGQASGLAGSVSTGLQKIFDALGVTADGSTDVRIGTSNGNIHVNTHGGQIGQKGSGDINFGSDQDGAIKAAIADALTDLTLAGISEASQRILKSGQDIDRAVSKALAIESIPKDLKAMLDPVGAALDALNTKWKATVAALDEGGASAEQRAQAERLYKLQLDQVKASTASASQGLKDFLLTLKIGSNSPLSLRDQETAAKAALQPYLDTIGAGGNVDQAKYQSAAQSLLDVERQLYGSTQAFFDQFGAIQEATNRAIGNIDNAVPITPAVESPFVKATADSTAATADGVMTGNEIAAQQTDLLASIASSLAKLAANGGTLSSGFIGGARNFTVAA